ncbi:MAG: leucine--tRNA ligase, partial [Bdellovibrionota bacterium]|nr:leucine--tRNA ligase [Bdellovibrionota bacterium]
TGAYATNPVNGAKIPIWVADYVLISYGTGAIMAVPAHDERDWEFAKKYDLPIIEVLKGGNVSEEAFTGDGEHVNSDFLDGLGKTEGIEKMISWLEDKKLGEKKTNYKLRDWLFSRQRYWGEPFPILKFEDGTVRCLDADELPVTLPEVEKYEPSGTGESPLATIDEWLYLTDPKTGKKARRETNTMPQWAGSCWYYLRFIDPTNSEKAWDEELEKYWMPVDLYVGGVEHATLHLLYARFWHKVLFDLGLVSTSEPFRKLVNQGMILAEDGEKMSKSRGNVINPDDIVSEFGADSLRMYEMFMGPLEKVKPWQTKGVKGVHNFIRKSYAFYGNKENTYEGAEIDQDVLKTLHKTIKKVTEDIENMRFNTGISAMMVMNNEIIKKDRKVSIETAKTVAKILSPYAPHAAEEMWANLGEKTSVSLEQWPSFDADLAKDDLITMAVQVNGKTRSTLEVPADIDKDEFLKMAKADEKVSKFLDGTIVKEIYVPGRICNIVVKANK